LLSLVFRGSSTRFGCGEVAAEFGAERCAFLCSSSGGKSEYESCGASLKDRVELSECGQQIAFLPGNGHRRRYS
jgi:hypothetical protein